MPNALHALAAEAIRANTRYDGPELPASVQREATFRPLLPNASLVLDRYADWIPQIDPVNGRSVLAHNLDVLGNMDDAAEPDVYLFSGRIDVGLAGNHHLTTATAT